jgi:hypothetical protein
MLLYQNSVPVENPPLNLASLAFAPQLLLSVFLIPLVMAKKDLASSMLAQTFCFVTFNKVCTSQVSNSARRLGTSADAALVLFMVPCFPANVSAGFVIAEEPSKRYNRVGLVDCWSGKLPNMHSMILANSP